MAEMQTYNRKIRDMENEAGGYRDRLRDGQN